MKVAKGTRGKRRANSEGTIRERTDGRWEARLTLPNGKQQSVYGKTQQEVLKKRDQMKRDIASGIRIGDAKQTVAHFMTYWIELHGETIDDSTYVRYRNEMKQRIIPLLGEVQLSKLTKQRVQEWIMEMKEQGESTYCIGRACLVFSMAMKFAEQMNLIVKNPMSGVKKPRYVKRQQMKSPWTEIEAQLFVRSIKGHFYELPFLLALTSGMREGEIIALKWRAIYWETREIMIEASITCNRQEKIIIDGTKTEASERRIPLTNSVVVMLRERYEQQKLNGPDDLVFRSIKGVIVPATSLRLAFRTAIVKAKLPIIKFHGLRHMATTLMLKRGVNIKVVSQILGHANIEMTLNLYAHVLEEMSQHAAIVMDNFMKDS